jgi:hypothetical protein
LAQLPAARDSGVCSLSVRPSNQRINNLGEKLQLARRDSVIHRNRAPALEWFYKMRTNFLRFGELFWYQTSLIYSKCDSLVAVTEEGK